MSNKEIFAQDMNEILPSIADIIDHYEINISEMCKKLGIPRSTLYDFLYGKSKVLSRIQKMISYLEVEISIKPSSK